MSPAATPAGCSREFAWCIGQQNPSTAWIFTPWKLWEQNPYYSGPPVTHPALVDFAPPDGEDLEVPS